MTKGRTRIAVVDDEESVRRAIERLLRSAGLEVETFASGADFIHAMRIRPPDCVVLDLHMPDIDGFEVQSLIAESGVRLPIVAITGHDTPGSRTRALTGGASAYLLKPIDDLVLLDAIAAAVSKQVCRG